MTDRRMRWPSSSVTRSSTSACEYPTSPRNRSFQRSRQIVFHAEDTYSWLKSRSDPQAVLERERLTGLHLSLPLQGAESLAEAGQRVAQHLVEAMRQLAQHVQQDTLKVFVGHGAAMRHAAWYIGVLDLADVARLSMFHAQPVCLEYSDAGWQHVGGDWKVRDATAQPD